MFRQFLIDMTVVSRVASGIAECSCMPRGRVPPHEQGSRTLGGAINDYNRQVHVYQSWMDPLIVRQVDAI